MQRSEKISSWNVWLSIIATFLIVVFSSCSKGPVDKIQPVVERIIYETVNELEQVPQEFFDGIWILDPSQQEIDQGATYIYVRGSVKATEPGSYRIGFSSNTDCQLQLGDLRIEYSGSTGDTNFRETAYGMYETDTLLIVLLDTMPIEVNISLRNIEGCRVYMVEEKDNGESVRIKFSPWDYASSDQKLFMSDFPSERWSREIISTQSRIRTVEDRYFKKEAYNEWTYANGILLNSLLDLYSYTGDHKLKEFVESVGEFTIEILPTLSAEYFDQNALRTANYRMLRKVMLDDTGAPTLPYVELYNITGREEYLKLTQEMVEYVSTGQERLPDGTLCRPEPVPGSIWSDDLFMASSLLLKFNEVSADSALISDCILQIDQMHQYLWDPECQLHRHGYFSRSGEQSPVCWIRSNGWLLWSFSNALLNIPASDPSYPKIMEIFQKSVNGLIEYQGANGLWHQILTDENSFEETSGSAMFTLSIARGVTNGWLPEEYREYAVKGWEGISRKIDGDKVFDICQGTGIGLDEEFYRNRKRFINDPRGIGALITCAIEMDKLGQ